MRKIYHYDEGSDSLYIPIKEGEEDSFEEIVPGISLEFNDKKELIGVEILNASRFNKNVKQQA